MVSLCGLGGPRTPRNPPVSAGTLSLQACATTLKLWQGRVFQKPTFWYSGRTGSSHQSHGTQRSRPAIPLATCRRRTRTGATPPTLAGSPQLLPPLLDWFRGRLWRRMRGAPANRKVRRRPRARGLSGSEAKVHNLGTEEAKQKDRCEFQPSLRRTVILSHKTRKKPGAGSHAFNSSLGKQRQGMSVSSGPNRFVQ